MATQIFLKIDDVEGESRDKAHSDEIDVRAWSWGMMQPTSSHSGSGRRSGKVEFQNLTITKYFDQASAALMSGCASGRHFSNATLTVRKAGKETLEYLIMELSNVTITSIATSGTDEEDRPTESITLQFTTVKTTYTRQNERGEAKGKVEFGWDIETNVPI